MKKAPKGYLFINTKAYAEGTGPGALRLARTCRKLSRGAKAEIVLCVQAPDIWPVSRLVKTFSQNIDAVTPGAFTGHVLAESVKLAGASGTLLNHSERSITLQEIRDRLKRAREARLSALCCAPYTVMVGSIARMKPDFVAVEPPELIGSGVSVSTSKPYVIKRSAEIVRKESPRTKLLCGAGVSSGEDVAKAIELGAAGVLVASAIVKAKSQEKAVRDILGGFG